MSSWTLKIWVLYFIWNKFYSYLTHVASYIAKTLWNHVVNLYESCREIYIVQTELIIILFARVISIYDHRVFVNVGNLHLVFNSYKICFIFICPKNKIKVELMIKITLKATQLIAFRETKELKSQQLISNYDVFKRLSTQPEFQRSICW